MRLGLLGIGEMAPASSGDCHQPAVCGAAAAEARTIAALAGMYRAQDRTREERMKRLARWVFMLLGASGWLGDLGAPDSRQPDRVAIPLSS